MLDGLIAVCRRGKNIERVAEHRPPELVRAKLITRVIDAIVNRNLPQCEWIYALQAPDGNCKLAGDLSVFDDAYRYHSASRNSAWLFWY